MSTINNAFAGPSNIGGGYWEPKDASASTAIDRLQQSEIAERRLAGLHGHSALTGDELMGAVLEGVNDPGNEAQELRQLFAFAQDHQGRMDPSGVRVAHVVAKYRDLVEVRPDGALTQAEKTAMAKEMAEAAKPRWLDGIRDVVAPAFQKIETPFKDMNDGVIGTLSPAPTGKLHELFADASASTAIDTLKKQEFHQNILGAVTGRSNRTTGDELMGAVLEGTADPGNEAKELRQLQSYANSARGQLNDSGKRVASVVDKYLAIAESRIGGSLTQAEKTQMAKDLAAAAQAQWGDDRPFIIQHRG